MRDQLVDHTTIYIDPHQDYRALAQESPHFTIKTLEWPTESGNLASCDWAFWAGEFLVMGEEKKPGDYNTSLSSRRLQRQLRNVMLMADIPVLGLRLDNYAFMTELYSWDMTRWGMEEINKWSNWGRVVFLPKAAKDTMNTLLTLRNMMAKPKAAENMTIFAGTDRKPPTAPDPTVQALMRLFDGVGRKTAEKLVKNFEGYKLKQILQQPPATWKWAGANKNVLKQLEGLQ
jgi:hypothetical protein